MCWPFADDSTWNKKLKRPRMTMVADEVQTKESAKKRLLTGMKRRVPNDAKIEVFEEEEDDDEGMEGSDNEDRGGRRMLQLTIRADRSRGGGELDSGAQVTSDQFRGNVSARLGSRRNSSGDSLERDTGEDLRDELDRRHQVQMLIRVGSR